MAEQTTLMQYSVLFTDHQSLSRSPDLFSGGAKLRNHAGQRKTTWELILLIHLYNSNTKSWDHVGAVPYMSTYLVDQFT